MAEDKIIKFKRGLKENLPRHGIEGMPYFTMDTGEIYMGLGDDKALKKIAVQEKVITFVCKVGKAGSFGPIIQFPYKGKILSASANCEIASSNEAILNIKKISESDYRNGIDNWQSVFLKGLTIPANKTFDDKNYQFQDNSEILNVNKNDYFRLYMSEYSNIQNITFQLVIELTDI